MFFRSHLSPAAIADGDLPSCMSFIRLGITKATVGNWLKSDGKSSGNRRLEESAIVLPLGTLEKLIQGVCLRAYRPCRSTSDPTSGRPSEYPLKEWPVRINSSPKLEVLKVEAGILSTYPTFWLLPENSQK